MTRTPWVSERKGWAGVENVPCYRFHLCLCLLADTGSLKLGQYKFEGDDDDAGSAVMPAAVPPAPLRPVYDGPLPTPPQKAFQPGSTPAHLTHRFMVGHALSDGGAASCESGYQPLYLKL